MELLDNILCGVPLQQSPALLSAGISHGFTTRLGGVSEGIYASLNLGLSRGDDRERVRENYRRVCNALSVDINQMVLSCQVHGDRVRRVTEADLGKGLDRAVDYEADGLVTDVPGATLVVFGADCLTILLADPVKRVIAAVHAGWRGTASGIVERAVEAMVDGYGCHTESILAAIGPGESARPFFAEGTGRKFKVDLKGLNALRLKNCGVLTTNVDISGDCTLCKPKKYWSHRYTKGQRGSQAALISLG